MADDVVIGSASVQIVGDYSGLEKSFNESQNLAQAAGQKISAAFESSASGANALTTAVGTVATSVEDLAAKSGLAGGELNLFRAALQGSLEAGVPVNDALRDMAASSATLGTAVAGAAQSLQQETQAAAGAVNANEAVSASLKRVRNDAEAFEKAWSEAIAENIKRSNAEFEKFANDVGNFISHPLQSAGAAVKGFLLEIGPMGAVALAGAAALAAVGAELFGLVKEFGATAEATQNMADRLNLTFQETRNLEEMAQIAGVSITGLQQASFRLAESLEGTSANGAKVAKALADIGVAGETSGELLTGFLQKLAEIPDDTKRIALAHEVLGKSSQQILPLIKNYAELQEAVKSLGPQIDENMAKKLTAADDALDKLSISWNRFKQNIAVFAAPAVQGFVDTLTAFVAGGTVKTIDQQIAEIEAKMVSLGEKSALAGWLMADGFTKGKNAELELLKAQREHLIGVEQAIERSREYNAEIAKSNAASKAASQPGLVQAIIDKQKELTEAVTSARNAYTTLNQAYQTGTPLASGYAVTSGDVARALANVKAAEAAAATTKADHTEKTKALTKAMPPLADRTAEWVAQIKAATTEHQKLISEASKLGDVIGRYVTVAEMAAIKTAALATSLRVANAGFEDGDVAIVSFMGNAEKIAPLMDQVADSINKAKQEALDTDPWKKFEEALDTLGIKGQQYYKDLADKADAAYQVVLDSGLATYEELATAALKAAEAEIRAALEVGDITRAEADKTLAQIESDLNKLDVASAGSAQARGRHERTLGEDIQSINKRTFDSLERGLAQSIINIKGFGDLWKTLWHKLAEDLLTIMFKVLLDPLEKQIGKVISNIPGLGGGGGGGSSIPGVPSIGGGGSPNTGQQVASQAAGMAVSSVVGMVTGAITAISSVVGNFQMAHMSSDLQKIEESTRYLKIGLVTQSDGLLNTSHQTLDAINQLVIQTKGIVGINLTGAISQDASNKLLDDLVNSGQSLYVVAARTLMEIRDSIRGGNELLMGQLHEIAKGVNPSVGQRLLNSAIGGLFSNITGAVGGIGSALGAVGSIFGGGGGNSSDSGKIEEHTRMLAIGMVTQGDSLLNDSHIIRNTLTDMMKWNMDVFQTYLQNINIDLDKLTNMGGVHSQSTQSQISTFSTNKAVVADQSTNVNVTIDTVASDVTDAKVRDVFNRGIRMSKLAGAFPAGRFPQ